MFKYVIQGSTNDRPRPMTLALTHFSDLAEFICSHAAEALDPEGKEGLTVNIIARPEADYYIHRPRGNKEAEK